ncbi:hypothetical protein CYMTET_23335 [Cymbomonas tetramitiformis]|uniref:Uncharacterized protein n=1 Tax=Cymbomonas tetramitiformis TaxID=36881 RepID=A0AAE0FZJ9_9CHLO|nr:hypothetical protein CYMTET_23335 [Cymbomonas tetramitiformis]
MQDAVDIFESTAETGRWLRNQGKCGWRVWRYHPPALYPCHKAVDKLTVELGAHADVVHFIRAGTVPPGKEAVVRGAVIESGHSTDGADSGGGAETVAYHPPRCAQAAGRRHHHLCRGTYSQQGCVS